MKTQKSECQLKREKMIRLDKTEIECYKKIQRLLVNNRAYVMLTQG